MKDLLKEAKVTNKPAMATAKDAGKEVQIMTLYKNTWVRKSGGGRWRNNNNTIGLYGSTEEAKKIVPYVKTFLVKCWEKRQQQ